ncbi:hypothetical protein BJ875DRAFT_457354 [Amylocarpus encephaloides]|uniref:F-box domain-containing protein n=1 Tax=Amylocarpus encephaloides TaxID=45428 RepID=A0A9P8C6V8_9HELO|nr:hypothetical protein BJ875DRAFT_457354 [Amylocarpus encephaloides]
MSAFTMTPTSLLGLPLELRHQIYGHIFHEQCQQEQSSINKDCICGARLSCTNRQLRTESRHLYFSHTRFNLQANNVKGFVKDMGGYIEHIKDLSITFADPPIIEAPLESLCATLLDKGTVQQLKLVFPRSSEPRLRRNLPRPFYWPGVASEAEMYDLELRPSRHSLAEIKTLRTLIILGHPLQLEESVFRLINNVANAGVRREDGQRHCGRCMIESHEGTLLYVIGMDLVGDASMDCSPFLDLLGSFEGRPVT